MASIVNASNHAKCISLNNQPCIARPTLINLNPDKYNEEWCYYPFMVNLDRCNGSCNTLDYPSNKVYVPNKAEDLNFHVFNMITRINESKTVAKHISCECKCDGRKWNGEKCWCDCKNLEKNVMCVKKIITGILLQVLVKMVNI